MKRMKSALILVGTLSACAADEAAPLEVSSSAQTLLGNPITKVQPIGWSASSFYPGKQPSLVSDGNPATEWNAGGPAPAWIMLDLGRPMSIGSIGLLPDLSDQPNLNGLVSYSILVGDDPANLRLAYHQGTGTLLTDNVPLFAHSGDGSSSYFQDA